MRLTLLILTLFRRATITISMSIRITIRLSSTLMKANLFFSHQFKSNRFILSTSITILLMLLLMTQRTLRSFKLTSRLLQGIIRQGTILLLRMFRHLIRRLNLVNFQRLRFIQRVLNRMLLTRNRHIINVIMIILALTRIRRVISPMTNFNTINIIRSTSHRAHFTLNIRGSTPLIRLVSISPLVHNSVRPQHLLLSIRGHITHLELRRPSNVSHLTPRTTINRMSSVRLPTLSLKIRTNFMRVSNGTSQIIMGQFKIIRSLTNRVPSLITNRINIIMRIRVLLKFRATRRVNRRHLRRNHIKRLIKRQQQSRRQLIFYFITRSVRNRHTSPKFFNVRRFQCYLHGARNGSKSFSKAKRTGGQMFDEGTLPSSQWFNCFYGSWASMDVRGEVAALFNVHCPVVTNNVV